MVSMHIGSALTWVCKKETLLFFDFGHGRGLGILDRWLHVPCIEKRTTGMAGCMDVMLNESLALVYHWFWFGLTWFLVVSSLDFGFPFLPMFFT